MTNGQNKQTNKHMDELLIEPCPQIRSRFGSDDDRTMNVIFSKVSFQVCNSQIEGDKDEQDRDEQEMKEREIFGSSSIIVFL